jgi:hypothetical protein
MVLTETVCGADWNTCFGKRRGCLSGSICKFAERFPEAKEKLYGWWIVEAYHHPRALEPHEDNEVGGLL